MAGNPKAQIDITAKNNTKGGLDSVEKSVKGMAGNVSTAMKAMFAGAIAGALGGLFKRAVQESQDSAKAMLGVSNALTNIGLKADALTPQLDALFNQLSNKTGLDDEAIAGAFTNLVRRTGDYNQALKLLPQALDVAAARSMDLESASEAVAKAQEGSAKAMKLVANTQGAAEQQGATFVGTLGRIQTAWGNVLQAVGDAITGNDRMAGSSNFLVDTLVNVEHWIRENESGIQTFISAIAKLTTAFFSIVGFLTRTVYRAFQGFQTIVVDLALSFAETGPTLKLALGQALLALGWFFDQANGLLNKLGIHIADGLVASVNQSGSRMVQEARTHLAELEKVRDEQYAAIYGTNKAGSSQASPQTAQPLQGFSGKGVPKDDKNAKKKEDAVLKEIEHQKELRALEDKRVAANDRLFAIMQQQDALARNSSLEDEERLLAVARRDAAAKALGIDPNFTPNANAKATVEGAAPVTPQGAQNPGEAFRAAAGLVTPIDEMTRGAIDSVAELDTALADLAGGSVRALGDAFSEAFEAAIDGSATLGGALIGAARAAVGMEAQARGRLSFAKAAEALAAGFFGNPAAFAAAAKYAAAGTAYYGLAAAMGKGGGSRGGTGGGAAGGASRGLEDSRSANAGKGDATIVLPSHGFLDMTDPRVATAFANAISDLTGRRVITKFGD